MALKTKLPGVPSCPASHGRPAENARAANGQSCLQGCVTTAHLMPLALLVAQTRIEAGVHSTLEVASGGLLGALVTLVVFQGFSA